MEQEQASLLEILCHPGDLETRLVYADWLEDHDRAEHEILRTEHQLTTADQDDVEELSKRLHSLTESVSAFWLEIVGIRWSVVLHSYQRERTDPGFRHYIDTIKHVRRQSGFGLRDSKELVDRPPGVIRRGVLRDQAESISNLFEAPTAELRLEPTSLEDVSREMVAEAWSERFENETSWGDPTSPEEEYLRLDRLLDCISPLDVRSITIEERLQNQRNALDMEALNLSPRFRLMLRRSDRVTNEVWVMLRQILLPEEVLSLWLRSPVLLKSWVSERRGQALLEALSVCMDVTLEPM